MGTSIKSDVELIGFALSNCVVEIDPTLTKYLRVVHRTALELAIPNQFGAEIGGFWLMAEQISELQQLPEYYGPLEARQVNKAISAYLNAQLGNFDLDLMEACLRDFARHLPPTYGQELTY